MHKSNIMTNSVNSESSQKPAEVKGSIKALHITNQHGSDPRPSSFL
jgi:hypothetical protein